MFFTFFKAILVLNEKVSRAIRLEGPAGVGKSTLFNFLKESIEAERKDRSPSTQYILNNTDIFSAYFILQGNIYDFGIFKKRGKFVCPY